MCKCKCLLCRCSLCNPPASFIFNVSFIIQACLFAVVAGPSLLQLSCCASIPRSFPLSCRHSDTENRLNYRVAAGRAEETDNGGRGARTASLTSPSSILHPPSVTMTTSLSVFILSLIVPPLQAESFALWLEWEGKTKPVFSLQHWTPSSWLFLGQYSPFFFSFFLSDLLFVWPFTGDPHREVHFVAEAQIKGYQEVSHYKSRLHSDCFLLSWSNFYRFFLCLLEFFGNGDFVALTQ